ncbi:CGNR zinc finger domain-containing protein [Streptomyces sp. NPDC004111]|uniref:CGNR zinc finger domain-containing protein n=1 Tax=Streptomyces sp. NPDC004111 TaxID=3364690 RepID=UPI003699F27F
MLSMDTARRTVALINVLCAAEEGAEGEARAAVTAVLREHGEPEPFVLTGADLADLRAAALLLREVFAAGDTGGAAGTDLAAEALNGLLSRTRGGLRLTSHSGTTPWHPHLDGDDEAPWGEWFLASSCLALTVLLWDRGAAPGGLCGAAGCPHVYLAHGAGPERRYCSRRCATRERVAAHRRARAAERTAAPGGA